MLNKVDEQAACDAAQRAAIMQVWTTFFDSLAGGQVDEQECKARFKKGLDLVRRVAGIVDVLL